MHLCRLKNIAFQSSQQNNNSSINLFFFFLNILNKSCAVRSPWADFPETPSVLWASCLRGSSSSFRMVQETVQCFLFPIRHCKHQCFLPTGCKRHSSLPADTIGRLLSRWWPMRWLILSNTWSFVRTFKKRKRCSEFVGGINFNISRVESFFAHYRLHACPYRSLRVHQQ